MAYASCHKDITTKYVLPRRPILNANYSEMWKCRSSLCFHCMLVLLVRGKKHDQNFSCICFKYSVLHIYVGWWVIIITILQITDTDEFATYSKSMHTQTPTERPIRRSILLSYLLLSDWVCHWFPTDSLTPSNEQSRHNDRILPKSFWSLIPRKLRSRVRILFEVCMKANFPVRLDQWYSTWGTRTPGWIREYMLGVRTI